MEESKLAIKLRIFHNSKRKTSRNVRENPKKHSVGIIVWLYTILQRKYSSCNLIYSKLPWLKKGHLVNIPKPWRCLGFKKLLLAGLFSTSVTWKNQITLGTIFLRVRRTITSTKDNFQRHLKYYFKTWEKRKWDHLETRRVHFGTWRVHFDLEEFILRPFWIGRVHF